MLNQYGNNLIKVRIWSYLANQNGTETEDGIRSKIQKELNISRRKLTTYLDNVSQPTIQEFFTIAQILKCTLNELIEPAKAVKAQVRRKTQKKVKVAA